MSAVNKSEVWLRGPVAGIRPVLQPVVHALLQAREELDELMNNFPAALLWEKPLAMASVGFHLQHMKGVLDRLFSYADGRMLSAAQLAQLAAEGKPTTETVEDLVQQFNEQVNKSILVLGTVREQVLMEPRAVGRAQLPSTVIGLYVHAAEHTMRHLGQLLVTVKWLTVEKS